MKGKMLMWKRLISILIIYMIVAMGFLETTSSETEAVFTGTWHFVGGKGSRNYTTIQDAINAANDGDTIFVYKGRYTRGVFINKTISLIGEDKEKTIVDGEEGPYSVKIGSDWVNITDFTVTGSKMNAPGIELKGKRNCKFTNNIFSDNNCGIYSWNSDNNTISHNIFHKNEVGIWLINNSDNNTIINNILIENYYGLRIVPNSNDNIIHHNDFIDNTIHATDNGTNKWDDGNGEGNYWSDYEEKYPSATNDGTVWDTPYEISNGSNKDNRPLVDEVEPVQFKLPSDNLEKIFIWLIPSVIVVVVIVALSFFRKKSRLKKEKQKVEEEKTVSKDGVEDDSPPAKE